MRIPGLRTLAAMLLACSARAEDDAVAHREDGMQTVPLRTHSLYMPYTEAHLQNRWWDFGGDTIIRQGEYIRLTSERASQQGWLFSRLPLTATSWEIEVMFKISGSGHLYGDGMAMWITKQRASPGPVFGHTDKFEGLGIFVDTYKNSRPGITFPYVMAMLGDGEKSYDSSNDGKDQEFAGCSARGIRNSEGIARMKVIYLADQEFRVELLYPEEENWRVCFTTAPPILPSASYLGFSAETGELNDNHDIISVSARSLYAPPTSNHQNLNSHKYSGGSVHDGSHGSGAGGWFWSLLKFVLFVAVCGGAYVGYTAWRIQQRKSRF